MSNYFGISSDSISTLFSNLSSNSSSGSSSILSDYAQIKNGSYYKLMKSYYANKESSSSESTSTSTDTAKKLTSIKSVSDGLKDTMNQLVSKGSSSVFSKKNVTGEDGTTTYGYDTNGIYKAVNQFVTDYNATVNATAEAKSVSVLTPASSMVSYTAENSKLLSQIGITINSDNTLSINEATFKNSNMTDVKSLFQGAGSYGYTVESKAFAISTAAQAESSKSNTYTNTGTYTVNNSSVFDDFI